jgi:hypothetical protein
MFAGNVDLLTVQFITIPHSNIKKRQELLFICVCVCVQRSECRGGGSRAAKKFSSSQQRGAEEAGVPACTG